VRFNDGFTSLFLNNAVLIARGTEDDSISFIPHGEFWPWGAIWIGGVDASAEFDYCYFLRGGNNWMYYGLLCITNEVGVIVRNSTFEECMTAMGVHFGITPLLVENCYFLHPAEPCVFVFQENTNIEINNSVFVDQIRDGFSVVHAKGGIVENCTFINASVSIRFDTYLRNSIFINTDSPGVHFVDEAGGFIDDEPYLSFNCFSGEPDDPFPFRNEPLANIGVLDRTNANGDSTDRYGNLFMDPRLAGGDEFPESYSLQEDSPCIDAGNPDADSDPDGTITDIGPFFFPQCNIRVNQDEIEFIDVQTGTIAESELEIRNVGLQPLEILDMRIVPEDEPFGVDVGEWPNEILPDSTYTIWVVFVPRHEDSYEAVLQIESNDRDEGFIEINLTGTALGIDSRGENAPIEFAIQSIYPNPFNSTATITYSLPFASYLSLSLYDLSGHKVKTLVDDCLRSGIHCAVFHSDNLVSGVYLIRIETAGLTSTREIVLIR